MRVTTLACRDLAPNAVPPDLDGVHYVDDLCRGPAEIAGLIDGADRLVLVIHPEDLALAQIQQRARLAGIDPLGLQIVPAVTVSNDRAPAAALLEAAAARAAAFPGSSPEHARPRFGGRRSRRELLSLPRPHYEAVPLIAEDSCVAGDGCRACVIECPEGAYEWVAGTIRFDRDTCVTCGRCVTACPVGAIRNPTVTGRALMAQILAVGAGSAAEPFGIAFVCRQRTRFVSAPEWTEIEVPCTGMMPATWPIAALLLGAASTAALPCAASGCGLGNDERTIASVGFAAELLRAGGLDPAAVATEAGSLSRPIRTLALEDPFGTHGSVEVALAIQSLSHTEEPLTVWGESTPNGVVTLDEAACTLCLACVEICPSGALASAATDSRVSVTFDAAGCTGCSQCVRACPEIGRGAITMERRLDTAALSAGRTIAAASGTAPCERCGAPIASVAMLSRISDLLGEEHEAAVSYLHRRCMDCRGAG